MRRFAALALARVSPRSPRHAAAVGAQGAPVVPPLQLSTELLSRRDFKAAAASHIRAKDDEPSTPAGRTTEDAADDVNREFQNMVSATGIQDTSDGDLEESIAREQGARHTARRAAHYAVRHHG